MAGLMCINTYAAVVKKGPADLAGGIRVRQ
jgi:hypothetical protein